VHRTFLEFMGARAAVAAGDIRLLADQAKQESWRETIVFAAGQATGKARDQLVRELLKKRWLTSRPVEAQVTAACCLETVGHSLDPALLNDLKAIARRLFPPQNTATAQLLAPAAAMEPELLEGHVTARPATVAACIRAAAIVGGPRMLDVIASYAEVERHEVEAETARVAGLRWARLCRTGDQATNVVSRPDHVRARSGAAPMSPAPDRARAGFTAVQRGQIESRRAPTGASP
jgi:hypothetical protein